MLENDVSQSEEKYLHSAFFNSSSCCVFNWPEDLSLGSFFILTYNIKIFQLYFSQGVEPNLNPNGKLEWTVSFWRTRTEPEPVKFYFSEPEPNLNPQNCPQVNPNRTWTPNKSKNIFFHIRMPLALVYAQ